MVNLKTYLLKDITLSQEVLSLNVDKFWSEVFNENKEELVIWRKRGFFVRQYGA